MIRLGPTLKLPDDAVTQTFAFLARKGAGKTYGAGVLAEGMLDIGAQIVVLDPVGVWYGLRLAPNGRDPSPFKLPVLGGLHGDVPIEPAGGALVADVVVDRGISAVVDVSMMRKNERKRFATDFAEQLFHRKKASRSPLHVFIEEAQVFVPQRYKGEETMLGAFEDLVKLGRNFGIGVTLISQRPQAVNKDALNQTEALFVLQTNGAQERDALKAWIVEHAPGKTSLVDELPGLQTGVAYLWSPSWLRLLERVQIGRKQSFDASSTPTATTAQATNPRPLTGDDLEALRTAMTAAVERAEAEDPKALRKRIAALQRDVATAQARVHEKVFSEAEITTLREATASIGAICDDFTQRWKKINEQYFSTLEYSLKPLRESIAQLLAKADSAARPSAPAAEAYHSLVPPTRADKALVLAPAGAVGEKLGRAERALLTVVARHGSCTTVQLAILSGYSIKSSSFANALGRLRSLGLVNSGSPIRISEQGQDAVKEMGELVTLPPKGKPLIDYWRSRLGRAEASILDVLVEAHPTPLTNEMISSRSGYSQTSSSFSNALGKLRSLALAEGYGEVRASEALFS